MKNYGFLGYKYALGRFCLWSNSNPIVFFGILVTLGIVTIFTTVYCAIFMPVHYYPIVLSGSTLMGLWVGLAVWGKEYQELIPEYWIAKRRKYLREYPELAQILHDGDLITDEEIEQIKNIRDNYE